MLYCDDSSCQEVLDLRLGYYINVDDNTLVYCDKNYKYQKDSSKQGYYIHVTMDELI